jgi:hypothetical protein
MAMVMVVPEPERWGGSAARTASIVLAEHQRRDGTRLMARVCSPSLVWR